MNVTRRDILMCSKVIMVIMLVWLLVLFALWQPDECHQGYFPLREYNANLCVAIQNGQLLWDQMTFHYDYNSAITLVGNTEMMAFIILFGLAIVYYVTPENDEIQISNV